MTGPIHDINLKLAAEGKVVYKRKTIRGDVYILLEVATLETVELNWTEVEDLARGLRISPLTQEKTRMFKRAKKSEEQA